SLVFHPDPGRAEGCNLQPVTAEPPITLSYATSTVPRGCVSSGSVGNSHEVHILSVEWSKVSFPHFLHTSPRRGGMCLAPPPQLRLPLAPQDARLSPETTLAPGPEPPAATSEEQLLAWAQSTYQGITSYSKLRDPHWVQLHLGEGVWGWGLGGQRGGTGSDTGGGTGGGSHLEKLGKGLGGIPWFHSSPITEVNLSLSCPKRAGSNQILILQSRANLTWSLSVDNCHIQFLVSGNYKITTLFSQLIPGELLPDTEQGLIAKAFEKNCSVIASYSVIPASTHISLEIQEHVVRRAPVTPAPSAPTTDLLSRALLLMLQPWKCTDETMEIVIARSHLEPIKEVVNITLRDISCQAEKNATHFMLKTPLSHCGTSLEGRGHANNEPMLLVQGGEAHGAGVAVLEGPPSSHGRKVWRFRFTYTVPEGRHVPLSATLKCKAGLQVSVSNPPAPRDATMLVPTFSGGSLGGCPTPLAGGAWLGAASPVPREPVGSQPVPLTGCRVSPRLSLQPPPLQNNTIFEKVLEVTVKDSWRLPNNRGLGLAAVLGITFGAFLIGALLTAGLWYIYSHTRPISKLQPVSSTAPASESSSTNHSIGSTQSTPCSTSSMA
ncbi:EGLN protein, partial [Grus americana]|nr:EGLN protein [Grus americana]